MSLDLGALIGRVVLEDTEFQVTYRRIVTQFAGLGDSAKGAAAGTARLDEALASTGASGDKAAAGVGRAAKAETDAASAAVRHAAASARVAAVLAETAGESTRVQAATLRQVAAQDRLDAAQATGAATTRQLAGAQAGLISATDRARAAQEAAAASSSRWRTALAGAIRTAGGLGLMVGGFELVKKAIDIGKEASAFQREMLLVQTQAGASAAEVKNMNAQVLAMAGSVGTAPDKLATSLYHIESVGLRGAKALNVLRIAAEGAQVGRADLEQTTNALTAAVVSGISGVQNMSQAMGVLNAIVGAGDMRLSDLNNALGTGILITARVFGVSIREAGAALAVFGDNNIRGEDAATKLRMAMQDLAKPAAHADAVLAKIGLTAAQLRGALEQHGLTGALDLLRAKLDAAGVTGNKVGGFLEDAFTKRAGVGLAVLVELLDRYHQKLDQVTAGGATFASRWEATTKTISFQFQRLGAEVTSAAISIAEKAQPALTAFAGWLGTSLPHAATMLWHALQPVVETVGQALTGAWHVLAPVLSTAAGALSAVARFAASSATFLRPLTAIVIGLWAGFKGATLAVGLIRGVMAAIDGLRARAALASANVGNLFSGRAMQSMEQYTARLALAQAAQTAAVDEAAAAQARAYAQETAAAAEAAAAQQSFLAEAAAASAESAAVAQAAAEKQAAASALIAGEARAAAVQVDAAGETASLGWSAMLGPIGAIVGVLAVVGLGFMHSGNDAAAAAQQVKDYTQAINDDANALGAHTRAAVVDQLQQAGAYRTAVQAGVGQKQLTDALIAGGGALDDVTTKLRAYADAHSHMVVAGRMGKQVQEYDAEGRAALKLIGILGDQSSALGAAAVAADDKAAADGKVTRAQMAQTDSVAGTVDAIRAQVAAHHAAATAAATQSAEMAIVAEAEDNAKRATQGFDNALAALDGRMSNVSFALSFQQGLQSLNQTLKQGKDAFAGNSAAAVASKQAFLSSAQSITSQAAALRKQGTSAQDAAKFLNDHIAALRADAIHAGASTTAVDKFLHQLGLTPAQVETAFHVNAAAAWATIANTHARIRDLGTLIDNIKQHRIPGITADSGPGKAIIADAQKRIDAIIQHDKTTIDANHAPLKAKIAAAQDIVDALHQGRIPGITVNSAAWKAAVKDAQARVDALHGKQVQIDADNRRLRAAVADGQRAIDSVAQHKAPNLGVNTIMLSDAVAYAQARINSLQGRTVPVYVNTYFNNIGQPYTPGRTGRPMATGGTVTGGIPGRDSVPLVAMPGEEIIRTAQAEKWRPLLKAINAGAPGFAAGGTVGLPPSPVLHQYGTMTSQPTTGRDPLAAAVGQLVGAVHELVADARPIVLDGQKIGEVVVHGRAMAAMLHQVSNSLAAGRNTARR